MSSTSDTSDTNGGVAWSNETVIEDHEREQAATDRRERAERRESWREGKSAAAILESAIARERVTVDVTDDIHVAFQPLTGPESEHVQTLREQLANLDTTEQDPREALREFMQPVDEILARRSKEVLVDGDELPAHELTVEWFQSQLSVTRRVQLASRVSDGEAVPPEVVEQFLDEFVREDS